MRIQHLAHNLPLLPHVPLPPPQYAFNIFSHNSSMDVATGYNEEEQKMSKETKKIWGNKDVSGAVTHTCVLFAWTHRYTSFLQQGREWRRGARV